jgi:hypothetical protein
VDATTARICFCVGLRGASRSVRSRSSARVYRVFADWASASTGDPATHAAASRTTAMVFDIMAYYLT